ncbi:MAG: hypothetical protein JNL21_00085 [Myxococcales bacterium]|nr:hypothetical protein [Myxococcales bacterium]
MTGSNQRPKAAPPPLPLERFAELSAEIDAGVPEPEILEREKLTEATWASAKAYWLRRMADEAERKRFETTTRYQAIFKAKRAVFDSKLRRERDRASRVKVEIPENEAVKAATRELSAPLLSQLAPLSLPDAPPSTVPAPAPIHHPSPRPHSPAQSAMAAMMQPAAALPVQAPPPPAFVAQPATHRTGPVGPIPRNALPFDEPSSHAGVAPMTAPAPATAPTPNAALEPPPRRKWSTIVADVGSLGEAMPFKAPPPEPPKPVATQPAPPPPAPVEKKSSLGSTMTSNEGGTTQEMMPFSRSNGAVPAPPPVPPPAQSQPAQPAPTAGKRRHLASTMMVDPSEIDARGLPFGGSAPRQTPQPMRAQSPLPMPATTVPAPPHTDDDDDDQPRTKAIDPEAVRAAIAAATPFGGGRGSSPAIPAVSSSPKTSTLDASAFRPPSSNAGARGPKRFSINVFASLTAEIAEKPGDVDAIRRKYGITDAEHHEESQRWTEDFAQNEELRKRYLGIVQRYRGYLKGRG